MILRNFFEREASDDIFRGKFTLYTSLHHYTQKNVVTTPIEPTPADIHKKQYTIGSTTMGSKAISKGALRAGSGHDLGTNNGACSSDVRKVE